MCSYIIREFEKRQHCNDIIRYYFIGLIKLVLPLPLCFYLSIDYLCPLLTFSFYMPKKQYISYY